MNRTLIARVAGVAAIAATALLGTGAANAQVAMSQPGPQIQAKAVKAQAGPCTNYAYSTGDWVRIRATPGGEPILGYSMRWDHYSDAVWPRDYSGNWMKATNLRTGVTGWVSLDWVDWYEPTCV